MKPFQDKVVLITGASSGIGEALARQFSAQGAKVALLARREERIITLAAELSVKTQAIAIKCDVTKEGDLENAVTKIHQTLGPIDVVIANAGFGVTGRVEDLTLQDYQRQFDTNVYGVLRTFYATIDSLKQTQGRLVILGSVASYISPATTSAYCMSKYAVRSLAESLHAELAPYKVSVTLICPGFIKSEIRTVNNQGKYQPELKDPIPKWLRLDTDIAAKQMIRAIFNKKREQVITFHGKVALFIHGLFPNFVIWFLKKTYLRKK